MQVAGIILCGGASSRMGRDKASLPWRNGTLLSHAAANLSPCVDQLFISAAPGQKLPPIPLPFQRIDDTQPSAGPVSALADAFQSAANGGADVAIVLAVDMPDVTSSLLDLLKGALRPEHEAVVSLAQGHRQPLCAIYRTRLSTVLATYSKTPRVSLQSFLDKIPLRLLSEEEWKPAATSSAFRQMNTPEDYEAARLGDQPPAPATQEPN